MRWGGGGGGGVMYFHQRNTENYFCWSIFSDISKCGISQISLDQHCHYISSYLVDTEHKSVAMDSTTTSNYQLSKKIGNPLYGGKFFNIG